MVGLGVAMPINKAIFATMLTLPMATDVGAQYVASILPYTPQSGWQTVYNGFQFQEGFEDTTLAPGLSLTLEGGAFSFPETHNSLPALFDPLAVAATPFAGPITNNTWDGQHVATNYGHQSANPINQRWLNDLAPALNEAADSFTFNFSTPVLEFGVGLSNFQSPGGPAAITDHELIINGQSQGTIESFGGGAWDPGIYLRNGYLTISATAPMSTIQIRNISTSFKDAMVFDAAGFTAVPEPNAFALLTLLLCGLQSFRRRQRNCGT